MRLPWESWRQSMENEVSILQFVWRGSANVGRVLHPLYIIYLVSFRRFKVHCVSDRSTCVLGTKTEGSTPVSSARDSLVRSWRCAVSSTRPRPPSTGACRARADCRGVRSSSELAHRFRGKHLRAARQVRGAQLELRVVGQAGRVVAQLPDGDHADDGAAGRAERRHLPAGQRDPRTGPRALRRARHRGLGRGAHAGRHDRAPARGQGRAARRPGPLTLSPTRNIRMSDWSITFFLLLNFLNCVVCKCTHFLNKLQFASRRQAL